MEPEALRLLFFDVETSPMLAFTWNATPQYIPHSMLVHESFLFCYAAKYGDEKQVRSGKLTASEIEERDDSRIVQDLADLVRDADYVVAHNADRFDVPRLNTRLLMHGLEPIGPVQSIDTLKLAKRSFGFTHNKLDHLAQQMGFGSKIKTDFDLWEAVYHGDEVAMQRMLRYCKHDVVLLEQIFEKMKPYVKKLPRLFEASDVACPSCGSTYYEKRGFYHLNASTWQKLHCLNPQCGRYFKGPQSIQETRGGFRPL